MTKSCWESVPSIEIYSETSKKWKQPWTEETELLMRCFYWRQATTWPGLSASFYLNTNAYQFTIECSSIRSSSVLIKVEGKIMDCGIYGTLTFVSHCFKFRTTKFEMTSSLSKVSTQSQRLKSAVKTTDWNGLLWKGKRWGWWKCAGQDLQLSYLLKELRESVV